MDSWFIWYIWGMINAAVSIGAGVLIGSWLWNRRNRK